MTTSSPASRPSGQSVFTRAERVEVVSLFAVIGLVTAVAFFLLFLIAQRYDTPQRGAIAPILFGSLGIIAYILGVRHGVDADHIAAIDNTTRKLLQEKKRPLTVGTWFSLGHSTVVVGLVVALVFAFRFAQQLVPALQGVGSIVGLLVSGAFLWIIGLINIVIVLEVYRIFKGLKEGRLDERALEQQLSNRGFMNRYFGKLFGIVKSPRQIYPIGVLFGLGFDTATEIFLIAISVGVALSTSIPLYIVLIFPLLFTCGMVLVDTADGVTMRYAYGWAFLKPIRKVYYNLTVTIISVLVALAIGTVELIQVLSSELGLTSGPWAALNRIDFETLGFFVVAIFVVTWGVAVVYYRLKRFDDIPFGPSTIPALALADPRPEQ